MQLAWCPDHCEGGGTRLCQSQRLHLRSSQPHGVPESWSQSLYHGKPRHEWNVFLRTRNGAINVFRTEVRGYPGCPMEKEANGSNFMLRQSEKLLCLRPCLLFK